MAWSFGDIALTDTGSVVYIPAMGRPRGSKNKYSGSDRFPTCYQVDDQTGCWNWIKSRGSHGYGDFRRDGHKLAHRWSYATFVGPIPVGLWVLHRCDNHRCVNPEHLFVGDVDDNNKDMVAKGRHYSKGKTLEEVYGAEEAIRKKANLSQLLKEKPPLHRTPHTEETKAKIRAVKRTPESRAFHSEQMKAWHAAHPRSYTPEAKALQSERMREWWADRRKGTH